MDQRNRGALAASSGPMTPARDPVCGMMVDPATSKHRAEHGGTAYYFCCAGCREKFLADPAKYLRPAKPAPKPPAPSHALYTCPMHPQIRQAGPGACPLCGMALEPLESAADTGPNPELTDMTRRLWIGAALTLPVLVLEMGGHFPGLGLHRLVSPLASMWIQVRARYAGRALGRLAVLRARLGVAAQPLAQHVQPDRARRRRGLSLQPRRHASRPGCSRRACGRRTASWRSITKRPRSSPCWCCSGRCSNCAPASRPAAPSAPCSSSRPKPRGASATGGADEELPLERVTGRRPLAHPARRQRAGRRRRAGRAQRGRRIDGDRRIHAGGQGTGRQADRRHHQRHGRAGDAGRKGRLRHHAGAHRPTWSPRRSAAARRSSAWPTWWPPGSCPRSSPWRCWPSPPG